MVETEGKRVATVTEGIRGIEGGRDRGTKSGRDRGTENCRDKG